MQFTKVDDDAYDVRMNLDAILEIGSGLSALASNGDGSSAGERTEAISKGFMTAYDKFNQPEVVETTEAE